MTSRFGLGNVVAADVWAYPPGPNGPLLPIRAAIAYEAHL